MRLRVVALCLGLLTIPALFAQSDRGTITGTVSDPAGAVVAGANVQAKNIETGVVFDTVTSATGNYTIGQLPVGSYEVDVTVQGFKKCPHGYRGAGGAGAARRCLPGGRRRDRIGHGE